MAVGDAFTLKIHYQNTVTGIFVENQLHYRQDGVTLLGTPEADLVDGFRSTAEADLTSCFHSNYSIIGYAVIPRPGQVVTYEVGVTPVSGGLSGDQLPPNLAAIVSLKSDLFTRSGRGRIFLPPASEATNNAAGQVGGTHILNINTFMGNAVSVSNGILGPAYGLGVWSEKEQEFHELVSFVVRNYWGSQRGRRF